MKELKEKCGIFGVWDVPEASHMTYLGLFALQHRGQEGAGIVSSNHGVFFGHRASGLVQNIFSKENIAALQGSRAIGHVRYSTVGESSAKNLQPVWAESSTGDVAVSHNGTLTNAIGIRQELEDAGSVFHSFLDTEVIVHLMARAKGSPAERLEAALKKVEGAYSLLVMVRDGEKTRLLVARDPNGFRPLVLGRLGKGWVVSSETCAFDLVGAKYEREVEPGEIIEFSSEGMRAWKFLTIPEPTPCIFEWIYFSRPDSKVYGESVYEIRKKMGAILAQADQASGLKPDFVLPVPDSGVAAAIGYSQASGVPFELGLIRNHYIGRSFIEPHQSIRDFKVRVKQNPLPELLRGKSVAIVDDSIVRGTTSRKIIELILEAGAKEVHLRIAAPPTISPCYYGIDTPRKEDLIAARMTQPEIAKFLGVSSLRYLTMKEIYEGLGVKKKMCDACFTEKYPVFPKDPVPSCKSNLLTAK